MSKSLRRKLLILVLIAGSLGIHAANPVVEFQTNYGNFEVELYPDKAPESVENFLKYVDSKFYEGTIFHRIIPGFMIQGGGMTVDNKQKATRAPIKNEAKNGLTNTVGTIAMARTGQIHSATSQFFINTADNKFLNHGVRDYGYAVFGKVTKGYDICQKIEATKKKPNPDLPATVIITKVVVKDTALDAE